MTMLMSKGDRDRMAHRIERYVLYGELPGMQFVMDNLSLVPDPSIEMVRSIDSMLQTMLKRQREDNFYHTKSPIWFDRLAALANRLVTCRAAYLAHRAGRSVTLNVNGEGCPCKQDIRPGVWAVLSWEYHRLSEVIESR